MTMRLKTLLLETQLFLEEALDISIPLAKIVYTPKPEKEIAEGPEEKEGLSKYEKKCAETREKLKKAAGVQTGGHVKRFVEDGILKYYVTVPSDLGLSDPENVLCAVRITAHELAHVWMFECAAFADRYNDIYLNQAQISADFEATRKKLNSLLEQKGLAYRYPKVDTISQCAEVSLEFRKLFGDSPQKIEGMTESDCEQLYTLEGKLLTLGRSNAIAIDACNRTHENTSLLQEGWAEYASFVTLLAYWNYHRDSNLVNIEELYSKIHTPTKKGYNFLKPYSYGAKLFVSLNNTQKARDLAARATTDRQLKYECFKNWVKRKLALRL